MNGTVRYGASRFTAIAVMVLAIAAPLNEVARIEQGPSAIAFSSVGRVSRYLHNFDNQSIRLSA